MPGFACTRMLISSADGYVFLNVLKGISTRRSSSPMPKPPFGFSTTPITRKSVPSIMTSLPTASSPGKSTGATFSPSITTFSRCRSSPSLMKRPASVAALAYTWPKLACTPRKSMALTSPALVRTVCCCIQPVCKKVVTFFNPGHPAISACESSSVNGLRCRSSSGILPPWKPWSHLEINAVSAPNCLMFSWMVSSNPVINAATSMMTLTPRTTPKTVRPLRILCVRSVSIACLRFSPYACAIFVFQTSGLSPQRLDGIQFRRARRRINPKQDADDSAGGGEHRGLHHKLQQNMFLARAKRPANADLARSLGDAGQHDVHDDDPADDQEHAHQPDGDGCERASQVVPQLHNRIRTQDGEI